ncbi:hypothetical protein [Marixanthomonas spongiae]|uniref:TonB C-terminal domain-containing protein n=1 Tax=Marixanthomonas spongiae TaxID=2174845 RepID=A0A2U0HZG6_9FLAO|nr:hypothetical protein [Marixanthomonas spongiae]PVW14216.1 hypothetical protein DDV96_10430 [Marixanthomonas spongiae]
MKHLILYFIIAFTTVSCQFFETEKISSETFYDEELKTIDWNNVDQYPIFEPCSSFLDKASQKKCFENTLTTYLFEAVNNNRDKSLKELNDTVYVRFLVSEKGQLSVKNMDLDSLTKAELPNFEQNLRNKIDAIKLIAPAYKRGIPVKTHFTLPIVLQTGGDL